MINSNLADLADLASCEPRGSVEPNSVAQSNKAIPEGRAPE
jgi:hypothetical protein